MDGRLLDDLRGVVGADHVVADPDVLRSVGTDWTGRFSAAPGCLVRPRTTAEVAEVVRACRDARVPVTPQGGNTGLVGGAVPTVGGVVLSTARLQRCDPVDDTTGTVVVGAGVTLAALAAHVDAAGWAFGVDLASRDAATVGGMVATDAGGAHVVRHGSMRAQVLGLEAVLADGTVTAPWLAAAGKDTAGYRLDHLLVGSEGTLGVVTAARLRLVRPDDATATLLLGIAAVDDLAAAVAAVRRVVDGTPAALVACEFVTAGGLGLVAEATGLRVPLSDPAALLVELTGPVDEDTLVALAAVADTGPDGPHAVVAVDPSDRRRLWALRERHAEAINRLGTPVKLDVAVPAARLGALLDRAPTAVEAVAPGARTVLFGHAAEANCHVNVVPGGDDPGTAERVEDAVLALVAELGGTVSAEHGIGRAKVRHLALTRDAGTISAMRTLKRALDPTGVLNPGVLLGADVASPDVGGP